MMVEANQILKDDIDSEDSCSPKHQAHKPCAVGDLSELDLCRSVLLDVPILDPLF